MTSLPGWIGKKLNRLFSLISQPSPTARHFSKYNVAPRRRVHEVRRRLLDRLGKADSSRRFRKPAITPSTKA
jgi:hypothetical protein